MFDESKVRYYTLPDALVLADWQPMTDAQTRRRGSPAEAKLAVEHMR